MQADFQMEKPTWILVNLLGGLLKSELNANAVKMSAIGCQRSHDRKGLKSLVKVVQKEDFLVGLIYETHHLTDKVF